MSYNRDELLADLKENVVEVTFKKLDGDTRIMKCTLMNNMLPRNYNPDHMHEMHHKEENKAVIAAWDIVKGGWRSFHVENVEYAQVLDNF
jgi:hypothetical protein